MQNNRDAGKRDSAGNQKITPKLSSKWKWCSWSFIYLGFSLFWLYSGEIRRSIRSLRDKIRQSFCKVVTKIINYFKVSQFTRGLRKLGERYRVQTTQSKCCKIKDLQPLIWPRDINELKKQPAVDTSIANKWLRLGMIHQLLLVGVEVDRKRDKEWVFVVCKQLDIYLSSPWLTKIT